MRGGRQGHAPPSHPERCGVAAVRQSGPNLAKGDFLAKEGRSGAKSSRESACRAARDVHKDAPGGRKVRRNRLLRSFESTEGSNPSERAVEPGHNAWSNRQSELVVRVSAQL